MKDRRNCKIIQDLLPNYIEGLTNQETNQFIEEHLNECNECKKMYTDMKQKLSEEGKENSKEKVDYLRKYNRKIKSFRKFMITIILVCIFIFGISTSRKMLIISSMNDEIMDYLKEDNYYAKITNYGGDTINITEKYNKGNDYFSKTTVISMDNNLNKVISNYKKGEQINTYIETGSAKVAMLNSGGMLNFEAFETWYERLGINNIWELFKLSVVSSISSEKCNNKECYRITNKEIFINADNFDMIYYIEKDTGLPVRCISETTIENHVGDGVIDYQYDIRHVTDKILEEPEITEYKITQN